MLFNSLQFALFFPLFLSLYLAAPCRARLPLLLVGSCLFYMAFIPAYILILALLILVDFAAGLALEASRGASRPLLMGLSLLANLSILGAFKYWNFLVWNANEFLGTPMLPLVTWALPIGLSFHTFQSLAYTIEVYRGRWPAERNLLRYAVYVLFFPQMVAGPIERPQGLLGQLGAGPRFSLTANTVGLRLILLGFVKKLVIADRLAPFVNETFDHIGDYLGPRLWLATFFFSLQIYCDFSGYTDIAQGLARLLGYELCTNFRRPYMACNLADFWRRWHISLSSWFRDYLYIPLGGSRHGAGRRVLCLLLTFLVSGLWHGAAWTFVIWGALHGAGVALASLWPVRLPRPLAWLLTLLWVESCWVFFRASSVGAACAVLSNGFLGWPQGAASPAAVLGEQPGVTLTNLILALAVLVWQAAAESSNASSEQLLAARPIPERHALYVLLLLAILFLGRFASREFLYFQF